VVGYSAEVMKKVLNLEPAEIMIFKVLNLKPAEIMKKYSI
jgi:hypothetical protein